MEIASILAQLKGEREQIDRAITALEGLGSGRGRGRPAGSSGARRPRRHMSAAARKRISEMMKLRWAERKRKNR